MSSLFRILSFVLVSLIILPLEVQSQPLQEIGGFDQNKVVISKFAWFSWYFCPRESDLTIIPNATTKQLEGIYLQDIKPIFNELKDDLSKKFEVSESILFSEKYLQVKVKEDKYTMSAFINSEGFIAFVISASNVTSYSDLLIYNQVIDEFYGKLFYSIYEKLNSPCKGKDVKEGIDSPETHDELFKDKFITISSRLDRKTGSIVNFITDNNMLVGVGHNVDFTLSKNDINHITTNYSEEEVNFPIPIWDDIKNNIFSNSTKIKIHHLVIKPNYDKLSSITAYKNSNIWPNYAYWNFADQFKREILCINKLSFVGNEQLTFFSESVPDFRSSIIKNLESLSVVGIPNTPIGSKYLHSPMTPTMFYNMHTIYLPYFTNVLNDCMDLKDKLDLIVSNRILITSLTIQSGDIQVSRIYANDFNDIKNSRLVKISFDRLEKPLNFFEGKLDLYNNQINSYERELESFQIVYQSLLSEQNLKAARIGLNVSESTLKVSERTENIAFWTLIATFTFSLSSLIISIYNLIAQKRKAKQVEELSES